MSSAPISVAASRSAQRDASLELSIVHAINGVRAAHGLRPLRVSAGLHTAAVAHTSALASRGLFQHDSPDGTSYGSRVGQTYPASGFAAWSVGENLVFGSAPLSAAEAVRAWLRSPPHRRNLLSASWRDIGVGAIVASDAGGAFGRGTVTIVTADFGARRR